ncbi:MAG TPA: malto-oligosyltrehalose trehalohydrolase, partial [Dongiaceae bacterium]
MSARHVMSLSHGASLLAADRTLFQFWAPDRARVDLDIDGQATRPMRRERDGWYRIEHGCGAGTRYRYRLGPDLAVPDPASRHQMDDVHGFSEVVNPAAYRWRNASWPGRPWEEVVIYEAHAGIMGGFKGLQAKLADLVELGITAIELMPIADFPGPRNWG